jgi:hypothetical protein
MCLKAENPADRYALRADVKQRMVARAPRWSRFVMVPFVWADRLKGATGNTYGLALHLLYLHWRDHSETIRLANKALLAMGISRQSKWRALRELERRGLIVVDQRPNKSPAVRLLNLPQG